MAIPNRSTQIQRVADWLSDEKNEERTAEELGKLIIDGIYDMWTRGVEDAPMPLKVGVGFKTPLSTKIHYVGWMGKAFWGRKAGAQEVAWIVTSDSTYGSLTCQSDGFWRIVTESVDNRKDKSKPRPGEPGVNADGWKVGDRLSAFQRMYEYEILAVAEKCVLLRKKGSLILNAESNAGLKKYYRRETR
jgi:hypothetical protein